MFSIPNIFFVEIVFVIVVVLLQNCKGFNPVNYNYHVRVSKNKMIDTPSCHYPNYISTSTHLYSSLAKQNIIINTKQIDLSTGINAEIMVCKPPDDKSPLSSLQMLFTSKSKPPLIFIHGSFHASWCWAEKFFPFFAKLGYPCYALSLRGTGGTFAGEGVSRVNIMDHVNDFTSFLDYVCKEEVNKSPVVFAHSFGGLCVMKYLEKYLLTDNDNENEKSDRKIPRFLSSDQDVRANNDVNDKKLGLPHSLTGVCLMCSVPPSGNGKMTLRFLKRSLKDSWKITAGLALRKVITDEELCRNLFFGGEVIKDGEQVVQDWGISDEDIQRYQGYFKRDTVATINLGDLAKRLPSSHVDKQGRALFGDDIPPALVIGATGDSIVDEDGVIETANYFGVEPTFVDSPHDVMLGNNWKKSADKIAQWLETL